MLQKIMGTVIINLIMQKYMRSKALLPCKSPFWYTVCPKHPDSIPAQNMLESQVTMLIHVSSQILQEELDLDSVPKDSSLSGWNETWKRIQLQALTLNNPNHHKCVQEGLLLEFLTNTMRRWQYQKRKVHKEQLKAIQVHLNNYSGLKAIRRDKWKTQHNWLFLSYIHFVYWIFYW